MADQTISQLNRLTGAALAANDQLPIVDVSASETKHIYAADLIQNGIALTASGNIDLSKLNQNSTIKLGSDAIGAGAITAAKFAADSSIAEQGTAPISDNFLGRGWYRTTDSNFFVYSAGDYQQVVMPTAGIANSAITTAKIADAAVTTAKIAAGGLTAAGIADGAITTAKVVDGAITSAKIADGTIVNGDIAASTITSSRLAAGAVDNNALAASAITSNKFAVGAVNTTAIADLAVTNAKIADTTIAYAKLNLADGSVPGAKITDSSITSAKIVDGTIVTADLADASITAAKIVTSGVTAGKIDTNAVTTATIASAAVTADKIGVGAVGTAALASSGITSAKFAAEAVDNTALGASAVTNSKIADTTITYAKLNLADGSVPGAKITDGSITSAKIVDGTIVTADLADLSITSGKIAESGVTAGKIGASAVTTATVAANAITAEKLANGAVGTLALADSGITTGKFAVGAVDTTALGALAVTNDKIANTTIAYGKLNLADGSVPGTKITSATISGLQLSTGGVLTANIADSAVTNVKIAASGIGAGKLDADAVVTVNILDDAITQAKIADGAVATAQIADSGVTAAKFANNSSSIVAANAPVGNGAFVGQKWFDDSTKFEYTWDGGAWERQAAISALTFTDSTPIAFAVSYPDEYSATITTTLDNQSSNFFFAGPASGAASTPTFRSITSTDLPIATDALNGAVRPGDGLAVDGAGVLNHSNVAIAGTYAGPVTIDAQGHITTAQATLAAEDIPSLDASKITTGTFGSSFLAANSVTASQLADYGIAQVSETAPVPEFAGQWWINPNDRSAYIWVGAVTPAIEGYWLNLGYGSASQINLRFGGTYNASGNIVESINSYGIEAGLTIGQALHSPNTSNNGLYLIVTASGVGTTPAPNQSLAVGNWVLSQGVGDTWTKINLSSAVAGVGDQDVLVDGGALVPAASGVASQEDFNEIVWGRVQIANLSTAGIVRASSEIAVASGTGIMTVGILDDGTF